MVSLVQCYLLQADVRTDKTSEFIGRNLSKTFESGNLRIGTKLFDGLLALFVAIAITGDEIALLVRLGISFSNSLLVLYLSTTIAHTEKRRLKNIYMTFLNELGEELQEEGDDEQADVHTVDIGIGSHNDLIVSQGVQAIFDIEGGLKQIELLVLVDNLLGESETVERFTTE